MLDCIIDLSHFNGTPDFAQVKAAGIVGVILKATQGVGYVDPTFLANREAAKAAGLLVGAYHFGTGSYDGIAQADHFLEAVGPESDTLVALDFEQNSQGASMTMNQAVLFINEIVRKLGRHPVFYTGYYVRQVLGGTVAEELTHCPLWIASYTDHPVLQASWQTWTLWQHTEKGIVPGVSGLCDRSFFNGDNTADLKNFWGASGVDPSSATVTMAE